MKPIGVDELKRMQLDILDDIASFCEGNGLRYFLAYGTLIGAIRHKGFIPWDDDIDLMMPRPDYERFLNLYNNRQSHYKVIHSKNEKEYFAPFAKVHDPRTRYQESYSVETPYGVFIDIFPLDGYKDDRQRSKCYRLFNLIHYKSLTVNKRNSLWKNISICLIKTALWPLSIKGICFRLERFSQQRPYDESEFVYYFSELVPPFERAWFDECDFLLFEGRRYCVPKAYHKLQTLLYGDYMTLPPIGERVNKHNAKVWWK